MSPALDPICRPEKRSATALGRLIAVGAHGCGQAQPQQGGRVHGWSNHPGQDRGETFAIATLIALTVSALVAGAIAKAGGGWLMIILLTVPGFFAGIHLLIFAATIIDWLLKILGLRFDLPPGHFCGRLFLGLLTLLCLAVLAKPESGCWLRLVAGAWCSLAALNALAWILFVAGDLFRELSRGTKP